MWAQLPQDIVHGILSHASWPLNVLCRVCKYANEHGKLRSAHVDLRTCYVLKSKLARINNLHSLTLGSNFINLISYGSLTSLDIGTVLFGDFEIAELTNLRRLVFTNNKYITNEGISKLTQLRHVYTNDMVTDRGIAGMSLYTLGIGASISNLAHFTELCNLHIGKIKPPPIPPCIIRLYLTGTNITEKDLASLTNLHTLDITGNIGMINLSQFTTIQSLVLNTKSVTSIPRSVIRLTTGQGSIYNVTDNKLLLIPPGHIVKTRNGKKFMMATK